MKFKAAVVGGTGYAGVELLRLLAEHPNVELTSVTSRGDAGKPVAENFPSLRGLVNLAFIEPNVDQLCEHDVVFFATPHGICMDMAPKLVAKGVKVIDLGADFRINNVSVWEQYYNMPHTCPDLISDAVYGLPEVHREDIKKAQLVANPGCYPTATILGLKPLLENNLVNIEQVIVDAKSGVSGAGKSAKIPNLYTEVSEDFRAYGVAGHRHSPEIAEQLSMLAGSDVGLTFVPHLLPMIRGILSTIYTSLNDTKANINSLQSLYEKTYKGEAFIDVLPQGMLPNTSSVRGSNKCRISVNTQTASQSLIVVSVIDNLLKGASGQAVQNMNLMLGLDELTGIAAASVYP